MFGILSFQLGYRLILRCGSISNPNVALWTGSCGSLIGAGCDIGSGGFVSTALINNLGKPIICKLVGESSDEGTFDLTLQNNVDCEACLLTSTMMVDPYLLMVRISLVLLLPFALLFMNGIKPIPIGFMVSFQLWVVLGRI